MFLADINQCNALDTIREKIEQFRKSRSKYRTANLWLQYLKMICIQRDFKKSRDNLQLVAALESLKAIIPHFTAFCPNLYAKSAWAYLNQMECIKEDNAEVAALLEKKDTI